MSKGDLCVLIDYDVLVQCSWHYTPFCYIYTTLLKCNVFDLPFIQEKVPGGFIHGDIKPPNVMVCAPPHPDEPYVRIKLIDFGLAHCIRVGDGGRHLEHIVHFNGARVDLNQTDRREMTPGYASPEWLLGHADLTLSDLWAVAVTVLELLIGGPLYRCTHEDDLVAYYQLAPIWRLFGHAELGDFYQRLPDDPFRRFFTQEAPSPFSPRARPGWRLKTLEEVSAEWRVGAITATPRPKLTWEVEEFTLEKIELRRPRDEKRQYPDLLGQLFDLLQTIFVIDPDERATINESLDDGVFKHQALRGVI